MVHITEKKFNYFFQKEKLKIFHPHLQCKPLITLDNYSVSTMKKTSIPSSFQYSNDISSSIYSVTIIIVFATWIFKKETYVNRFLYVSLPPLPLPNQMSTSNRQYDLFCYYQKYINRNFIPTDFRFTFFL
jgi:hypothetical protein